MFSTRMILILSFLGMFMASAVFYLFLQTRAPIKEPKTFVGAPAVTSRIPETQFPPESSVLSKPLPPAATRIQDGEEKKEEPPQTAFGQTPSLFFLPEEQRSFFAPLVPAPLENLFSPAPTPAAPSFFSSPPLPVSVAPPSTTEDPYAAYAALTGEPFPEELKTAAPPDDFDSLRQNMIQAGIIKESDFVDLATVQDIEAFSYATLDYQVLSGQMTAEEAAQAKSFLSSLYAQMR